MTVVMTTVDTYTPPKQMAMKTECEDFRVLDRDTVYSELPPGLIDLRTAANEVGQGTSRATLHSWVTRIAFLLAWMAIHTCFPR